MKRISIDWENSAEEWWHHAGRSRTVPPVARGLISGGPDDLFVNDDDAGRIMGWARSLPGWSGGPKHAPHPLTIHDADQKSDETKIP